MRRIVELILAIIRICLDTDWFKLKIYAEGQNSSFRQILLQNDSDFQHWRIAHQKWTYCALLMSNHSFWLWQVLNNSVQIYFFKTNFVLITATSWILIENKSDAFHTKSEHTVPCFLEIMSQLLVLVSFKKISSNIFL